MPIRFAFSVSLSALLAAGAVRANDVKLNAFVDLEHISYFENDDPAKVNARNQAITQIDIASPAGSQAAAKASLEFRADQADPARNRVLLKEAYATLFFDKADFKVGRQIFSWGKADGFNPTDVLAPRDFTDPLLTDDTRLGILAAKLGVRAFGMDLEAVASPGFQPGLLPQANSRWMPEPDLPPVPGLRLRMNAPALPDEDITETQLAGRLSASIGGWDISLMHAYARNPVPTFRRELFMSPDSIVLAVSPEYRRRRVFGGDFSTALGSYGLRGEAAYFVEDEDASVSGVDDPYCKMVAGVDRTFNNVIGENNLFVLLQWLQEFDQDAKGYATDDLNHLFQKALSLRMEYDIGSNVKLSVQMVRDFEAEDYYLAPKVSYSPADGLNVYASVELPGGEMGGFFGNYEGNRRAHLRIRYDM
jgi:hypothetical protein